MAAGEGTGPWGGGWQWGRGGGWEEKEVSAGLLLVGGLC